MRALASLVLVACSSPAPTPIAAPAPRSIDAGMTAPIDAEAIASGPPIDAPALPSKLVDLASLPAWPLASSADPPAVSPMTIVAADADLDSLLVLALPIHRPLIARATGVHVTGQVTAPSRGAAFATLSALAPDPAALVVGAKLVGREPYVSLQFAAAPARELFRLLAEVLRIDLVVPPGLETLAIDVVVAHAPTDTMLARLADLAGLEVRRDGRLVYLIPHGGKLPAKPRVAHPRLIDLDTRDATASDVVRAIGALAPLDHHVACDTGAKLELHLHHVGTDTALGAIAYASGLPIEPGAANCPIEPTPIDPPPATAKLAIVVSREIALLEDGATRWLVKPVPDVIEIGASWVAYRKTNQGFALRELGNDRSWLDEPWRLAATVIGIGPPTAVLESPLGASHWVTATVGANATVLPGRVVVTEPGRAMFERLLERR